jgi:hypothetical protein
MADKNYVVSLTVDDSGAVAAVNQMTTALDNADTSTQSLKAQLRQMQQELQKLDVGSEEFQKLSLEAGKLKDQINDAAEAVRANAGNAFEGLKNNAGLLKDRLMNLDLEGVGQSFKGIAGNIKGISFKEVQSGISALGSGLASIGKALLTNPLFLLAAAIGAAVAYSDELLSLVDGISEADQEQLNAQKEKAALANQQLDTIGAQEEILKEQGKTEEEIRDLKQQALDVAIEEQKVVIATQKSQLTAQIQAAERNRQILNGILQFLTAPLQLLLGAVDGIILGLNKVGAISDETYAGIGSLRENLNNAITGLLFDPEQIKKDGEAAIKESEAQLLKLENQAAGFRNKDREDAKKKNQEKIDDKKKAAEEELSVSELMAQLTEDDAEEIEKNNEALAARVRAIWEKAYALSTQAQQAQADEIKAIQDELDVYLDEKGKSAQELELQRLQDAYFEKKTLLENAGQDATAITEKYEAEQKAIKDKYAQEDADRERRVQDAKIGYAAQGINALGGLLDAFSNKSKKNARANFQREKAFAIGAATINTYLAASAALALKPSESLFPGQRFVEMGLAIAAGIAQVTKIANSKFSDTGGDTPSGGGGVPGIGGGGGGNQGTVPTFNALNLGFLQNRPEQTPKAYVLAQDVSSAVEARDKVRDLARIN